MSARTADRNWIRLFGLMLLIVLLWRLDTGSALALLGQVAPGLLAAAILLNLPQVFLKAVRWRELLRSHQIHYPLAAATLSYFGSIFIGLLTPGRLGEFVKVFHVNHDCGVPVRRAFSSVLVDRLFDLVALLLFGGAALFSTAHATGSFLTFLYSTLILLLPAPVFLNSRLFSELGRLAGRSGAIGRKLFAPESWLVELRTYVLELPPQTILLAVLFTALAYALFFGQCYLLALALHLNITFLQACFAVSLGSLVTLLPLSISGLGTREAALVAYLGTTAVAAEAALGYSLLIFVTSYATVGLMGALAWWIKPVSLARIREIGIPRLF
jgi:glycosyltransferase 2 family protein